MKRKEYDEKGFPVAGEASKSPNLTVRRDAGLMEKVAALKDHYEAERRMPLSISDVVRAAIFQQAAVVQGGAKQPPPPPAKPAVPPYSDCNQCEEAEDGTEYKCCKCGRGLKATLMTDLMCIQGTAKEVDPLKKPAKKPAKKSRKAKE